MSEKNNDVGGIAADRLLAFLERRERLEEEKRGLQEDIKALNAEVKGTGFNLKTFNEMVKLRRMDKADRQEQEALRELYKEATGLVD